MKLKYRFPLYFSLALSLLLALVMIGIYYLFSDFRKTEFRSRLYEKAQTTGRLFIEVNEVDSALLTIIDKNNTRKLYQESVQIYNDSLKLLYASGETTHKPISFRELRKVKKAGQVFWSYDPDVFGLHYAFSNKDYYVFITAEDKYGIRKLNYLKFLLVISYAVAIALIWLLSFYLSRRILRSLLKVTNQIQEIDTGNRKIDLQDLQHNDEIKALASSFNTMMERIDVAYKSQQEFTSNAAHELRTPVARITSALENLMLANEHKPELHQHLESIRSDAYSLADTISSLLLLARIEASKGDTRFQNVRIDEVLFAARAQLLKTYPDFTFQFSIENKTGDETSIDIQGDESLLIIAFLNILRNAYTYSDDHLVKCVVCQTTRGLEVHIINHGETPSAAETPLLFNTFKRGSNARDKAGSGIGLSIVQRILHYHGAEIRYRIPANGTNEFIVRLHHSLSNKKFLYKEAESLS